MGHGDRQGGALMIYSLSIYHAHETGPSQSGVGAWERRDTGVGRARWEGVPWLSDSQGVGAGLARLFPVYVWEPVSIIAAVGGARFGEGAVGQGREGAGTKELPDHAQGAGGAARRRTKMASVLSGDGAGAEILPAVAPIYRLSIYHGIGGGYSPRRARGGRRGGCWHDMKSIDTSWQGKQPNPFNTPTEN